MSFIKLYKKSATLVDFDNKNNKQVSNNNINASSLGPKMAGLALTPMTQNLETSLHNASSMSSVERAIETIAAMAGKTHIKEELVNGSYRLQASMKLLSSLDLDARSSAAYGLAHIFALLTVTNAELHKIALAEKDITPEQFAKLQELQRIKGVKDENGNPIEEKLDNIDTDTDKIAATSKSFRTHFSLMRSVENTSLIIMLQMEINIFQMCSSNCVKTGSIYVSYLLVEIGMF